MKTLILKHNGHEAHVPYDLPEAIWIDVFVPEHGICHASVLLRADTIQVEEVTSQDTGPFPDALPDAENHPAVLEQARDVCAVFERALPIEPSECERADREGTSDFERRLEKTWGRWSRESSREDNIVLSIIGEMALLESDLHTTWCRLPDKVLRNLKAPENWAPSWHASKALNSFIVNVLVPRAQDMATAAAKRREAEWVQDAAHADYQSARWSALDMEIDLAKERA